MPDFILKNMTKDQLETVTHHMIHSSPFGIVILNEMLEVVFVNNNIKEIFTYSESEKNDIPYFGNLFGCKYVANDQSLPVCGSKRQCENCKIRNTMLNAIYFNRSIEKLRIKHNFIDRDIEIVKWFDLSAVPTKVNYKPHLIVILNDQTDWMNQKIEEDLSKMLSLGSVKEAKKFFHKQIMNTIQGGGNHKKEAFLIKLECKFTDETKLIEKQAFKTFVIQHIDAKMPYYEIDEDCLLIFMSGKSEVDIQCDIGNVSKFCNLNYKQACDFHYRILKIDVTHIKMNPQMSSKQIIAGISMWVAYIDKIPVDAVTIYKI